MTSSLKYQWAGWLIGRVQLLIAKQSSLQSRSPQPAKIKVQDVKVHLSWFLVGDLYDKSPDKSASFIHLGISLILLISIGFFSIFHPAQWSSSFSACYATPSPTHRLFHQCQMNMSIMSFNTSHDGHSRFVCCLERYGQEIESSTHMS